MLAQEILDPGFNSQFRRQGKKKNLEILIMMFNTKKNNNNKPLHI